MGRLDNWLGPQKKEVGGIFLPSASISQKKRFETCHFKIRKNVIVVSDKTCRIDGFVQLS